MIRFIAAILFIVIFLIVSIPIQLVLLIIKKSNPYAVKTASLKIVGFAFNTVMLICGIKVTVIGEENVPKDRSVLYVGNHRSYFDIIILQTLSKTPMGFVAKKEFRSFPLLPLYMEDIGSLFLDRENVRESLKTITEGTNRLSQGLSLGLFPEGTRNHTDQLLPFKPGGYRMAEKSGCPIILTASTVFSGCQANSRTDADVRDSMNETASVSETTRRNFIANVSHELKTPMTTIAGFIDGILDGTIPQNKQKQYLRIVSTEVKRLSRLVASMLSLSRIDNGELRISKQSFNLADVVISTLLTFEQKIEERHIDIQGLDTCMKPVKVEGDPDLIYQVVYNLFENAVKFVDTGGYIKVTLTEFSDRTELEIKNSGHGIEPDELVHIFERFYKTDKSRSQDKNGMGLGLYIVKTIMHLHGGDITASSVVDEYCSFTLWLPRNKPQGGVKGRFNSKKKSGGSSVTVLGSDGTIVSTAETIEEQHIDD